MDVPPFDEISDTLTKQLEDYLKTLNKQEVTTLTIADPIEITSCNLRASIFKYFLKALCFFDCRLSSNKRHLTSIFFNWPKD